MQLLIYLIALIIALGSGREAHSLPRPSNVTVTCDSYKVEVHWQYPRHIQDVRFRVEVESNNGKEFRYTSDHSFNISNMLKNPAFTSYVVRVMAMQADNSSEIAVSDIFSFNELATSTIKCVLDFPEVSLSAKDGKLHLQFSNPLHLYRNTPALRNNTDRLVYTAETEENDLKFICGVTFKQCETSIDFTEEREKYCLNLTGKIGQRPLKKKRECFYGDLKSYPHFTTYLYPVLGVVLTLLFITAIIMLLAKSCNKKIKKKAASAFPSFLDFKPTQTHLCKPLKLEPENVESDLQIEPISCNKDPTEFDAFVKSSTDKNQSSDWHSSSVCSEHCGENAEDLEDGTSSSDPAELTGNYHTSKSISDLSSGYDRPHALRLELYPGDLVEGYRP